MGEQHITTVFWADVDTDSVDWDKSVSWGALI